MVDDNRTSTNVTNQSLIRRFNHHSTMVLRACQARAPAAQQNGKTDSPDAKNGATAKTAATENGRVPKAGAGCSSSGINRFAEDEPTTKKVECLLF